jgi:hypothetical protein
VKFFCCFEGTKGLRQQPLKIKRVFCAEDRRAFDRLKLIRNKIVAHDEHLYPGEYAFLVTDRDASAIEAVILKVATPFSGLEDADHLQRLAAIARDWVAAEFETVATEIVTTFNAQPAEDRRSIIASTPEFTLNFGAPVDRL